MAQRYEPVTVTEDFIREQQDRIGAGVDKSNFFRACSEDITVFAKYMLGIDLYAWQVDFLKKIQEAIDGDSDQRHFAALTSRQIGKSTCLQVIALWVCIFNKRPVGQGNQTGVAIISATDKQAKKLLRKTRLMMYAGERFMHRKYDGKWTTGSKHELGEGKFFSTLISKEDPNNTTTITFKTPTEEMSKYLLRDSTNGSFIESHPPTAGVLGETVSFLIVDEAGRSEDIKDEFFNAELSPIGDYADAIRIYTSTPWEPSGFFYELCDPDDEYGSSADLSVYSIEALSEEPSVDAQRQYASAKKRIGEWEQKGKFDDVRKTYYCEFVKGELNYFEPEKVREVFDESLSKMQSYELPCDLGVDFGGQVKSQTSITISALDEDSGNIVRLYEHHYDINKDGSLIEDIETLWSYFNIQRVVVDDCPAGWAYINRMEQEKGWPVDRMQFKRDKVRKYGAFRVKMNEGLVFSYPDQELKDQMLALQQSKTSTQSKIVPATGKKDDIIDSFVISCFNFLDTQVRDYGFIDPDNYKYG